MHNVTLAKYKWTKHGMLGNEHTINLVGHYKETIVTGESGVPSTVGKAVRFMYEVSAKKLVVDEYTIELSI